MTRHFSVHDAVDVTKAVVVATFMTYVAVFTLTRLEGIPRSLPIIHALILISGLVWVRIFTRLFEARRTTLPPRKDRAAEHILMIGSTRLSLLYIKFIRAYSPGLHRIMAVLDDRPAMIGRAIDGIGVIGPTDHLEPVINEFAEHGVRINHIIVGGDPDMISESTLPEIRRICDEHQIRLDFVPELVGCSAFSRPSLQLSPSPRRRSLDLWPCHRTLDSKGCSMYLPAVTTIVLLSPIWLLVGAGRAVGCRIADLFLAAALGPRWPTFPAPEDSNLKTTIRLGWPKGTRS